MRLIDFVELYIEPNTLIRLVRKMSGGHQTVADDWDNIGMEWQILQREGIYKDYIDSRVIGIKDIVVDGKYPEAINIVIE